MMYNDLAEQMATADFELPVEMGGLQDVDHPLWSLGYAIGTNALYPENISTLAL